MIINKPRQLIHEWPRHFKTKKRVGELADKLFSSLGHEIDYKVRTVYEFLFDEIMTDRGVRCYRGDIVLFFIRGAGIQKIMNIEIDDFKKTDSKMNFRDYNLYNGVSLPPVELLARNLKIPELKVNAPRMSCPTLRINAGVVKDMKDSIIENELELFYFSKMELYSKVGQVT